MFSGQLHLQFGSPLKISLCDCGRWLFSGNSYVMYKVCSCGLLFQVVVVTDYAEGELFQILEDDGNLPEEQVQNYSWFLFKKFFSFSFWSV